MRITSFLLAAALCAALPGVARAQAAITGTVRDTSGDSIHPRQLEIHEGDVRRMKFELCDRFSPVAGLSDHLHVRLEIDEGRRRIQPTAHHRAHRAARIPGPRLPWAAFP
jgi:hypothetical protein